VFSGLVRSTRAQRLRLSDLSADSEVLRSLPCTAGRVQRPNPNAGVRSCSRHRNLSAATAHRIIPDNAVGLIARRCKTFARRSAGAIFRRAVYLLYREEEKLRSASRSKVLQAAAELNCIIRDNARPENPRLPSLQLFYSSFIILLFFIIFRLILLRQVLPELDQTWVIGIELQAAIQIA
jgi:hypothetical protein